MEFGVVFRTVLGPGSSGRPGPRPRLEKRELGSPPSDARRKSTANRSEWSTQYLTEWQRAIRRNGCRGQGGGQHCPEQKCLRGHFQNESHRFPTVRKPCRYLKIPKACGQPVLDQRNKRISHHRHILLRRMASGVPAFEKTTCRCSARLERSQPPTITNGNQIPTLSGADTPKDNRTCGQVHKKSGSWALRRPTDTQSR